MEIMLVQCPAWTVESPPYSLALLAASLKNHGYDVQCLDLNIELFRFCQNSSNSRISSINGESWNMDYRGNVWYETEKVSGFIKQHKNYIDELVEKVAVSTAKIIGFSVQSTSKEFSIEFARRVKEKNKNKIIVFGGPLCFKNCYGISLLKDFDFIDAVCFGEGEKAFPDFLDTFEAQQHIKKCAGFGLRLGGNLIADGDDNAPIQLLDDLDFADYTGFELEKYTKKLLPISTSRGCINNCSFCNESPHWIKYRRRSAANIIQEIKFHIKLSPSINNFWFNDSLINGDMKMLNELCELLIIDNLGIEWGGQGVVRKEMTLDFLTKMKQAGCRLISYGVESGSSVVLRLMRKGYAKELSQEVILNSYRAGINLIFNIIVGFPQAQFFCQIDLKRVA